MLSGLDQGRYETMRYERIGDRFEFDSFRPGPNDQPDLGETQPSP